MSLSFSRLRRSRAAAGITTFGIVLGITTVVSFGTLAITRSPAGHAQTDSDAPSSPKSPTSKPNTKSPKASLQPGFIYEFEWRHHGNRVGRTRVSLATDPAGYRIHGEWRFSGGGGNIATDSETVVDHEFQPVSLSSERHLTAATRGQAGKRVKVTCKERVAEIEVHLAGKEPRKREMELPEKCYFYEESFHEHFLLLGPVLASGGDHRKLLLPGRHIHPWNGLDPACDVRSQCRSRPSTSGPAPVRKITGCRYVTQTCALVGKNPAGRNRSRPNGKLKSSQTISRSSNDNL